MASERKLMIEFIQLYQELGCLWDTREPLYTNKEAREKAYEVLLEKYKLVVEDATIVDVRKKIEHMRSAYRRERKKVIKSLMENDDEHVPSLWYYEHFNFLNAIRDNHIKRKIRKEEATMKVEYLDIDDEDDDVDSADHQYTSEETSGQMGSGAGETSAKKRRVSDGFGSVVPTIYLPELHDTDPMNHDETSCTQEKTINTTTVTSGFATESQAFGTTVGLQLKGLDPLQRMIAEKLISDVIFHARFKKLTVDSTITIFTN